MDYVELRKLQNLHEHGWSKFVVQVGYPAVTPILPKLLGWLEDMNDPEAQLLAPFLAKIGKPLIPHIRNVFDSNNDIWKCYILWHIVAESPDVATAFRKEIERFAKSPTKNESAEGLDEISREILDKINKG